MSIRGFIDRLMGRPRQWVPPKGDGKEADDWRVGDLAACISDGPWLQVENGRPMPYEPQHGAIYRVADVGMVLGHHMLVLAEMPCAQWNAIAFRKITLNQRQACTEGFKLRMKGLRPTVDA